MSGAQSDAVAWRKSSASGNTNCLEVAFLDTGDVLLRDSKDPDGARLRFTAGEWAAFVAGVRKGELSACRDDGVARVPAPVDRSPSG